MGLNRCMFTPQETLENLTSFVVDSPTSFHAAHAAGERLTKAGFVRVDESTDFPSTPGKYFLIRSGAFVAWIVPENAEQTTPFHVLGAHTDSPSFKLKPRPSINTLGWLQAGVEVYGGPLLNSWLDRDLRLAGRLVLRDGKQVLVSTGPVARIPQLAIHLDRSANEGLSLDRQFNTYPIWGLEANDGYGVMDFLADEAEVDANDILGYDVLLADTQAPETFGGRSEFFASARLDNLSSVLPALMALEVAEPTGVIPVLAAFDHEEVGSGSNSGASGPILASTLERISVALGAQAQDHQRALSRSWCLSADAAHAVHPNYLGKHDPVNRPTPNAGPVLKLNANQRYATDGEGVAYIKALAEQGGIPLQEFVSNNDVPCGSTIGPLTATRVGMRTVDLGVGLLSMHSAREMCGASDPAYLASLTLQFFSR